MKIISKTRKILAIVLMSLLLISVCFIASGCEKKYDVSFQINCIEVQDGKRVVDSLGILIFDKDTDELYIERQYDGKEYQYYVMCYENPRYDPKFSSPYFQWITVGRPHTSLWKEGTPTDSICETICERGNYCYTFYIDFSNRLEYQPLINSRILRLYISVV